MNSSLTSLRTLRFLSLAASVAALAVVLAAALQQYPAPIFGFACAASVVLIMTRDYAPRRRWSLPLVAGRAATPRAQAQGCPLAA